MSEYSLKDFADLNAEAALIADQNSRYDRVSGYPESVRNARNRIAAEQAMQMQFLREVGPEFGCPELAVEHMAVTDEIAAIESGKLKSRSAHGVLALADRLAHECYLELADTIEANAAIRLAEVGAQTRQADSQRLDYLKRRLAYLGTIYAEASKPWPVPRAYFVEAPADELGPVVSRGPGLGSGDQAAPAFIPDGLEVEVAVPTAKKRPGGTLDRTWKPIGEVQRQASSMLIDFFVANPDRVVIAEELMRHLYKDRVPADTDLRVLRNRVTTLLWPGGRGTDIAERLKVDHGLKLEYLKARYVVRDESGDLRRLGTARTAYRAVSVVKDVAEANKSSIRNHEVDLSLLANVLG